MGRERRRTSNDLTIPCVIFNSLSIKAGGFGYRLLLLATSFDNCSLDPLATERV